MILYHYTSTDRFNQITRSWILNPSDPWTTMDKAYGYGWYFTDQSPDTCDAWTVARCWRRLDVFDKVECYLKLDISDHLLIKCREYVWMIKQGNWNGAITTGWPVKYIEGKKTPKCGKAVSCFICDVLSHVKKAFGWK